MRIRTECRGKGLTWGGGFSLGLLGVVLVSLVMSGCSSGGGSDGSTVGTSGLLSVEASGTWGIKPTYITCGEDQEEILWRSGWDPIGTVELANDQDYVYVKYETPGPWLIESIRVHVGQTSTDYPKWGSGGYKVDAFDYQDDAPLGEAWEEWEHAIPFTNIPYGVGNLDHGACGMTVYVFAFAWVVQLDDDGSGTHKWAWAGTDKLEPPEEKWLMYYIPYEVQCCYGGGGEFRTQSQGGWGTVCHGWNPGCYRDEWFDTAFPGGLTIGCDAEHTMTFTSSEAVEVFIPTGGKPGPLQQDYVDPTERTEAGVLASQVLALALNLGFDAVDPAFGSSDAALANQVFCDTVYDIEALSVQELFDEANLILGDCEGTLGLKPGEIVELLIMVNENYVDGECDEGFLCSP